MSKMCALNYMQCFIGKIFNIFTKVVIIFVKYN